MELSSEMCLDGLLVNTIGYIVVHSHVVVRDPMVSVPGILVIYGAVPFKERQLGYCNPIFPLCYPTPKHISQQSHTYLEVVTKLKGRPYTVQYYRKQKKVYSVWKHIYRTLAFKEAVYELCLSTISLHAGAVCCVIHTFCMYSMYYFFVRGLRVRMACLQPTKDFFPNCCMVENLTELCLISKETTATVQ